MVPDFFTFLVWAWVTNDLFALLISVHGRATKISLRWCEKCARVRSFWNVEEFASYFVYFGAIFGEGHGSELYYSGQKRRSKGLHKVDLEMDWEMG
jgi:hypothetical protein